MRSLLLSWLVVFLVGCAGTQRHSVYAEDDNFLIVRTVSGESYASLASEYLGHANRASVLKRYNPGVEVRDGSLVAIPRRNFNPVSVFADGYQRVPILCYHQFTEGPQTASNLVVTARQFEAEMAYLKRNGYQVVPLVDLADFLSGDKALPDRTVVITVDDGYKSFYTVAYPILKKYQYPSTLFVYPEFIGGRLGLSWSQLETLQADPLVNVQSHSLSHTSLAPHPGGENPDDYLARLAVEVETTDRILSKRLGQRVDLFAYPYGNSSPELVELLQDRDYHLAATVLGGGNASFAAPFLLRRTMVYPDESLELFKRRLDVYRHTELR